MVEKQHKPLGYVQNLYAKYTSEYNNIIGDSPHQQLEKEQKMIFGFGGESIGLLMMYFSVVNIMSFTFITLIGVIGLLCSIAIMKYSSKLINSAA